MSKLTQISATMSPALEPRAIRTNLGNVAYLPSLRIEILAGGHRPLPTVALIDTGADISLLDSSLFDALRETKRTVGSQRVVTTGWHGTRQKKIDIYHFGVRLIGDDPDTAIEFESVPIGIADITRPMILGHRGLLEWLNIQINFVSHRITLIRPTQQLDHYPALARELPGFQSVLDQAASGGVTGAIVTLAWELERFIDRFAQESQPLRRALQRIPKRERTLGRILKSACRAFKRDDLLPQCHALAEARNMAAHAQVDNLSLSVSDVLEIAQEIVGVINQSRSTSRKRVEPVDIKRLQSILRRSSRSFAYLRNEAGFGLTDSEFEKVINDHSEIFAATRIIDRDKQGKRKIPGRKGMKLKKHN